MPVQFVHKVPKQSHPILSCFTIPVTSRLKRSPKGLTDKVEACLYSEACQGGTAAMPSAGLNHGPRRQRARDGGDEPASSEVAGVVGKSRGRA
jgi:hypothetical protein